jgi:L-ascorbate metabolism protein UlaG (beta-lactamase superfamily)
MFRCLLSLLAVVSLTAPAAAKKVSIKWHGQAFFEITSSEGTIVVIDPHNIEGYGQREVKPNVVLMSHFHIDHAAPDQVVNYRTVKKLFGLKNKDNKDGGTAGNRKNDEFNEFKEEVKDVTIRCIGAYHDKMQGMVRGKTGIFILEVDGLKIVHLGDLGHLLSPAQIKAIGPVDILMVPIGGIYSLNGADAKEVVAQLKPRRFVIPMHYGTKVYDYLLNLEDSQFLEDQNEKNIKKFKYNELIVDSDDVPKPEPTIAILHYDQKEKKEDKKEDK